MKIVFNDYVVNDQTFFPIGSDEFIHILEYQKLIPNYVIPPETVEIRRNLRGVSMQSPQTASSLPTPSEWVATFDEEDRMITPGEIIV